MEHGIKCQKKIGSNHFFIFLIYYGLLFTFFLMKLVTDFIPLGAVFSGTWDSPAKKARE